jgi:hypothetical protein
MISEASPDRSDGGIVPNNPTKDRAPMHRFLVWFASYSGFNGQTLAALPLVYSTEELVPWLDARS